MARKSKKSKFNRRVGLISVGSVVIIAALALGFWHYHNQPTKEVIPSTAGKSASPLQESASSQSSTAPTPTSDKQSAAVGSSTSSIQNPTNGTDKPPIAPTGNFVSSHHPGTGTQAAEQSACNTTPGASCYITLTSGSDTKKLAPQITDGNGATIWNWDAGTLRSGTWQITATATLNGQTTTTTDSQDLVVQ